MNTNAKNVKSGSRKKKCKSTTEQNVALSNGMKIWQDSLADYTVKKKGCKSCASRATKKKRTSSVPKAGDWIIGEEAIRSLNPGEIMPEEEFQRMVDKIYNYSGEAFTHSITVNPNPTMKLEKDIKETIPSLSGRRIRLSSLRPGDWVDINGFTPGTVYRCHVVQNWPSIKRIEFRWPRGTYETAKYESVAGQATDDVVYVGKGERRKWWEHLPRFLRTSIAQYSQP